MSKQIIWSALIKAGMTPEGAAGMMGNMQAESALRSTNVEDRSGISDELYTQQVDSGARTRYAFAHDSYGYGLCQWTYYSRKEALYDFSKSAGVSIGDEGMQIAFLIKELKSDFPGVWQVLSKTNSVSAASNSVLLQFENPAGAMGQINYRYQLSQKIYEEFEHTDLSDDQSANPASVLSAWQQAGFATNVIDPAEGLNPGGIVLNGQGVANIPEGTVVYIQGNGDVQSTDVCYPGMPVLKKGDRGAAVAMVQQALKVNGYALGLTGPNGDGVDGVFGTQMEFSVNAFKSGHRLPNSGKELGVVTAEMWAALWK